MKVLTLEIVTLTDEQEKKIRDKIFKLLMEDENCDDFYFLRED